MSKQKAIVLAAGTLLVGILIGGYLFSDSQPRSLLALNRCEKCFSDQEFLGLLASAGIQKFHGLMPWKVFETDKTVAIKLPTFRQKGHFIIVPKKDIKNVGEISPHNAPYFVDALLVARSIIEREKLSKYRLYTNGPGSQQVSYLHFHLVVE